MAPIKMIDEQKRAVETGRIRTGIQVRTASGKVRPEKLETFRLTGRNHAAILAAARAFGGRTRQITEGRLGGQWEVVTDATVLPIVVPNTDAVSQWMERWTAAGCIRRCDGETSTLRGVSCPCDCPADRFARQQAAARGDACKPTTRVSVMLPDLPGLGVWRIESHGWSAAVEMAAVATVLGTASERGAFLPAHLRLDRREDRIPQGDKPPAVNVYYVPVIEVLTSLRDLAAGQATVELPPPPPALALTAGQPSPDTSIDDLDTAEGIASAARKSTSVDELRQLWHRASYINALDDYVSTGVDDSMVMVRDVITSRQGGDVS